MAPQTHKRAYESPTVVGSAVNSASAKLAIVQTRATAQETPDSSAAQQPEAMSTREKVRGAKKPTTTASNTATTATVAAHDHTVERRKHDHSDGLPSDVVQNRMGNDAYATYCSGADCAQK